MNKFKKATLTLIFILIFHSAAYGANWKITAYCSCKKCCGKFSDGITASGKKVHYGVVACNWISFGTKLHIKNLGYFTVEDRGAKSYFGDKNNHIKHLDVYLPEHKQALRFGVKYLDVTILK